MSNVLFFFLPFSFSSYWFREDRMSSEGLPCCSFLLRSSSLSSNRWSAELQTLLHIYTEFASPDTSRRTKQHPCFITFELILSCGEVASVQQPPSRGWREGEERGEERRGELVLPSNQSTCESEWSSFERKQIIDQDTESWNWFLGT